MATPNNILVRGDLRNTDEIPATAAITPGNLVAHQSTGKVAKHALDGAWAQRLIALDHPSVGKGVADNYATDDRVLVYAARPGDRAYVVLAASQTIVRGQALQSNGAGAFEIVESADGFRLCVALEAVTTTGATDYILVEFV